MGDGLLHEPVAQPDFMSRPQDACFAHSRNEKLPAFLFDPFLHCRFRAHRALTRKRQGVELGKRNFSVDNCGAYPVKPGGRS